MITAVIIDDEKSGRETLSFILKKHFADFVSIIGVSENLELGVTLIKNLKPDLVFLDIEMPNDIGLNIINKFDEINFEIIITTAHKQYGIESIKIGVCDYLLKPIDIEELDISLKKVMQNLTKKKSNIAFDLLTQQIETLSSSNQKIPLLINNGKTIFVNSNDIIRCEADGNYTKVFIIKSKAELVTKLLKDFESILNKSNFIRIHKSHLVNISHIKSFNKSDDYICMEDGSSVPLSRNLKTEFFKIMGI